MSKRMPINQGKGPLIITISSVCASLGAFALEFLPNTFFLEKYKSIVQMYKLGKEVPVDGKIIKLFDEVLDDLEIKHPKQRELYRPFVITGFNLQHAGVISKRFGSVIGIPINYTFEDKVSIDISELRLGRDQESLNIYNPATDDLLNSLVMSEKAKKFGIAREILMAQKDIPVYNCIESPLVIATFTIAAEVSKFQLNLANKPRILTVLLYGVTGLMGYSIWFQIRDNLYSYFERSVDKELANLGPDYVEGGIEFYEKLLQKNKALRILLGERGKNEFNMNGDEIFIIRNKKVPLTQRKKFFNEILMTNNNQQAL